MNTQLAYTPSGTDNPGIWTTGPLIPNVVQNVLDNNGATSSTSSVTGAAPDAPAVVMVNGKVLCVFSGQLYIDNRAGTNVSTYWKNQTNPQYPAPVSFYEYDPVTQTFGTQINGPTDLTDEIKGFQATLLALPDGKVLYSNYGSQLYVYDPGGTPLAAGKPTIASITTNPDGSYHLTGTGLNGLSTGAAYGDDAQMDTNFPLVRISDGTHTYYGRTFNWSSTGVQTGAASSSTEFVLPAEIAQGGGGVYSLVVVANGISSNPVLFAGEVWVDFAFPNLLINNGTFGLPYNSFVQGATAIGSGGQMWLRAGNSTETVTNLNKPMTLRAWLGPATIGR